MIFFKKLVEYRKFLLCRDVSTDNANTPFGPLSCRCTGRDWGTAVVSLL